MQTHANKSESKYKYMVYWRTLECGAEQNPGDNQERYSVDLCFIAGVNESLIMCCRAQSLDRMILESIRLGVRCSTSKFIDYLPES